MCFPVRLALALTAPNALLSTNLTINSSMPVAPFVHKPLTNAKRTPDNNTMAYCSPPFALRFPLLLAGSVLLAPPMTAWAQQVDCRADSNGQGWVCTPLSPTAALPPRPSRETVSPRPLEPRTQTVAAPQPAQTPPASSAHTLDWVPREQLSAEQQALIAPYCSGDYIEPTRDDMHNTLPISRLPLYARADSGQFETDQETGALSGNVVLRQGQLEARADQADFDRIAGQAVLTSNVQLRDQGMLVLGDRAELAIETGATRVDNARYVVHDLHARGEAEQLQRREDAIIQLDRSSYTTCEPGSNAWSLHGGKVELDRDKGWGEARNVTLKVKNLPVFYTPYIRFPIDDRRQSGFLVPSLSVSGNSGSELVTPYYFNLAPNYDATLYPQILTDRGLLLEGEFRYLTERSEGQLSAAYLDDQETERELQSEYTDQRWLFSWQNQSSLTRRLSASVDYSAISDPYYFQDLNTYTGISTGDFLDQRAGLRWRGDHFTAAAQVHAYERATVLDITPYERLPQLTLAGRLPYAPGGLQLDYNAEAVNFQRNLMSGFFTDRDGNPDERWYDENLAGLTRAEGWRMHLAPELSLPLSNSWGFVTPKLKLAYTYYDLDLDNRGQTSLLPQEQFRSSQDRFVPIFSVDSGIYLDRETSLFGNSWTQTLEPRLFYLYAAEEDQSDIPIFDSSLPSFSYAALWRDNRFSGYDRIGDANQLSLGLTNRWIQANGVERQRLSIGQTLYFQDRKVQLRGIDYRTRDSETASASPLALQHMLRFNADWRLTSELNWDPDQRSTRSGSTMLQYRPAENPRKLLNVGYRYRNDQLRFDRETGSWTFNPDYGVEGSNNYIANYYKTDQHDISFSWPLNHSWSVVGRWLHDYGRNQTVDAFAGVSYDSCCWSVSVVNRYWVDHDEASLNPRLNDEPDRGIFLQIVFKGLGNMAGSSVSSLLTESIPGYQERDHNAF